MFLNFDQYHSNPVIVVSMSMDTPPTETANIEPLIVPIRLSIQYCLWLFELHGCILYPISYTEMA